METWFAIAAGGALGAVLRGALVSFTQPPPDGPRVPASRTDPAWGIVIANTLGCLILGVWLARGLFLSTDLPVWVHALVITGICGGLSTFSTLCSDTLRLARVRSLTASALYVGATTVLGFAAFHAGLSLFQ